MVGKHGLRAVLVLIFASTVLGCRSASSPASSAVGQCFSNFDYSVSPTDDLLRAAVEAQGSLGSAVHLPGYYPPLLDVNDTRAGLIRSSRDGQAPGFAVQIGEAERGAFSMLVFYSSAPRCTLGPDTFNEAMWQGRQVRWSSQGNWPPESVDAILARFRSGNLEVELTLLWRSHDAPADDAQLDVLREVVISFPR